MTTAGFKSRFTDFLAPNGTLDLIQPELEVYEFVQTKVRDAASSFFVFNSKTVIEKYRIWTLQLPRVRPFYSIKANNDPNLLQILATLGVGFEVVSEGELNDVLALTSNPSEDIIFANPIKTQGQFSLTRKTNVNVLTFDNEDEIFKIARHYASARLVLRLRVRDDPNSIQPFGNKYGCPMNEVHRLLTLASERNLNVVGVSFHVGCRVLSPNYFKEAIASALAVFSIAQQLGFSFNLLNIGGGFPGTDWHGRPFPELSTEINDALQQYFPLNSWPGLRIIAEPGTYFCAAAFTFAAQVIGRRLDKVGGTKDFFLNKESASEEMHYFINDGLFGSFFGPLYGYPIAVRNLPMRPVISGEELMNRKEFTSTIWGETMASLDVVVSGVQFPELFVGEWILFKDMGDYSLSLTTKFCGFNSEKVVFDLNGEV